MTNLNVPEVENDSIVEATAAASTLKPGGAPGQSKSQMLSTFVELLGQLGKEDLSHFLNDSLAKIGHEADSIGGNAAEKNKATIAAVKEDMDDLFGEGSELSEDFRSQASTLFEAAINTRINLELAKLEEEAKEFALELEEEFEDKLRVLEEEIQQELTEKLDSYLDHVVESWLEENRIAVDNSLRAEIAEGFIEGLKTLFSEHYIEVPEERFDVLGEMKQEIEQLTNALNDAVNENIEISKALEESNKEVIIANAMDGLTETSAAKLASLAENVEYTDLEDYAKKVDLIKETFMNKTEKKDTGMIIESIDGKENLEGNDTEETYVSPNMEQYVKTISKTKI